MAGLTTKAYRYKETLPTKFNTGDIVELALAAKEAQKLGAPSESSGLLPIKLLVEGRSDAGTNKYDYNNPRARAIYNALQDQGFSHKASMYPAQSLYAKERSEKRGLPFEQVWNGLGRSEETGRTGAQHAQRVQEHLGALSDPRNASFLQLLRRVSSGNHEPSDYLSTMVPRENTVVDKLTPALLNVPQNSLKLGNEYTHRALSGASAKLDNAIDAMRKTESGKKLYDQLSKQYKTPDQQDVLWNIRDQYLARSGFEPNNTVKNTNPLSAAMYDIMTGNDPGGEYFLSEAQSRFPEEKGFLQKIREKLGFKRGGLVQMKECNCGR